MLEDKESSHNYRIKITSLQCLVNKVLNRDPTCCIEVRKSAFDGYVVLDALTADERNLIRHCILSL